MHVRRDAEDDAQFYRRANGVMVMRRPLSQIFKVQPGMPGVAAKLLNRPVAKPPLTVRQFVDGLMKRTRV